jgi:hypothetical protein
MVPLTRCVVCRIPDIKGSSPKDNYSKYSDAILVCTSDYRDPFVEQVLHVLTHYESLYCKKIIIIFLLLVGWD